MNEPGGRQAIDKMLHVEPGGSGNMFDFGGVFLFAVVVVAILMMCICGGVAVYALATAQAAKDEIADVKTADHNYYENVAVWETDAFNRLKDVELLLKEKTGIDADQRFGRQKPPPTP